MTARSSLLVHGDDAVLRARDGAPDEQQIPLGVDLDHRQPELGVAYRALVARHALPLDDARRIGARADGTRLPVPRVAVRCRTAAEAVAVHHALEAAPLRGARHLDQLAGREDVDLDLGARGRRIAVDRELPDDLGRRVETRRLRVPELRLGRVLRAALAEAELHGAGLHLHHA